MLSTGGSALNFAGASFTKDLSRSLLCKHKFARGTIIILRSEGKINEFSDDSTDIFKRNNIDRYTDKPN